MQSNWRIVGIAKDGNLVILAVGEHRASLRDHIVAEWTYAELCEISGGWYQVWRGNEWADAYAQDEPVEKLRMERRAKEISEGTLDGRSRCGRPRKTRAVA